MEKNDRVKNKMGKKSIVKIIERGGMRHGGRERKRGGKKEWREREGESYVYKCTPSYSEILGLAME